MCLKTFQMYEDNKNALIQFNLNSVTQYYK